MMRIIIYLAILLFGISGECFAEKYYLYIDKGSVPAVGEEAGQAEAGDVVTAKLYDPLKPPSESEASFYDIRIVDLTKAELDDLTQPEELLVEAKYSEIVPKSSYLAWVAANNNRTINKVTDIGANYVVEFSINGASQVIKFRKKKVDLINMKKDKELKKDDLISAVVIKPSIVTGVIP